MKVTKYKKVLYLILGFCVLLLFGGCGKKEASEDFFGQEQQQETTEIADEQIYILLYSDAERKIVFLESVASGVQEEFTYSGGTYVYDRYGGSSIMSEMKIGSLLEVSYTENKMLTEIRETSQAYVYDGITKFKIDEDKQMITIGDSSYYYDDKLKVFSGSNLISIGEIANGDTISIREMNREILTIVIDKGHGTVRLKNTDKFQGGMITIGNVIAQEIVRDMELEVPEGTYLLSVANQGYGGNQEITVNRFEELEVDLSALEGEGPGYCKLKIEITPSEATVRLNGDQIDCSETLDLRFGSYQLSATAEGYENWGGRLVISSDEATVTIQMKKEAASEEEEKEDTEGEETENEETENGEAEDSNESTSSVTVNSSNHSDSNSNNSNNNSNNNNNNNNSSNSSNNNNSNNNSNSNNNNSNNNSNSNNNNSNNNSNSNTSNNSNSSNNNSSNNNSSNNNSSNNNTSSNNNNSNSNTGNNSNSSNNHSNNNNSSNNNNTSSNNSNNNNSNNNSNNNNSSNSNTGNTSSNDSNNSNSNSNDTGSNNTDNNSSNHSNTNYTNDNGNSNNSSTNGSDNSNGDSSNDNTVQDSNTDGTSSEDTGTGGTSN